SRFDLDGLTCGADLHSRIRRSGHTGVDGYIFQHHDLEAGGLDSDLVGARRKVVYTVVADLVGLRSVQMPGLQIRDGDRCPDQRRAARIRYSSRNIAVSELRLQDG